MAKRRHRSLGEMISTAVFAGLGIVWVVFAWELINESEWLKGLGLLCCGIACGAAAIRFPIQNIFSVLGKK
tara:strand:+ start:777 stop:989 length:213 start_codon:yes stop_codon:yes gene_type:complete